MSCSRSKNNFNFNGCTTGSMVSTMTGGAETTVINFYKADWCGHCKNFKPEWEKLKELTKGMGNIKLNMYDEKSDEAKKANIKGWPTIIIIKGGKSEEYQGPRTAEAIMKKIGLDTAPNGGSKFSEMPAQCGGNYGNYDNYGNKEKSDAYYKTKYLKYKAKYMLVRSRLEN